MRVSLVALPLYLVVRLPAQTPAAQQARIVVEPDFPVSRDGNSPHVEVHAAANPRKSRNLIAGAITHTRPDGSPATKAYASFDGGRVWSDVVFPEQVANGGGDPQVAFTPRGTALFTSLNIHADDTGRTRAFLHAYRSEDGGKTWSPPADLGASYDHEMIAVDQTTGRFAGRIYLSTLYGREYDLGLFRSEDDGRSFVGPVPFYRAGGVEKGANTQPLAVFSDGALLVPFHEFPLGPARTAPSPRRSGFFTVLSTDGGVTFSAPRPGPDEVFPAYADPNMRLAGDGATAVDRSGRFPDRVYRVWQDARFANGRFRIAISYSTDRGATWSPARAIDASAPLNAQQFLAAAGVNKDGVLGISWQDSRDAGTDPGYHVYFSASVDGGVTFLPPQRLTSALSRPMGSGNLTVTPAFFRTPLDSGAIRLSFLSAAGRWANGGDYSGMAVDADGVFHPLWADARTGTFQAWTARVRVDEGPPPVRLAASTHVEDVTSTIEFIPDPSRYDAASNELTIALRLKNTGDRAISAPVTITIRKFGSGQGNDLREMAPSVLNATNRRTGEGATFVLDAALGTERLLRPGEVSGPIEMRFRVRDPLSIPNMHLVVSGSRPLPDKQ